jgi:hypothetical protein
VADVRLGSPHTVGFLLKDTNGSPVTSGVTGTIALYGPASTTATSGPTAMTHFGGGVWGVTFLASAMAASGLYKAFADSISYAAGTIVLDDQVVLFTVGVIPPNHRTLRECVVDLAIELDAGVEGTATGGSTTTMVDTTRINTNLAATEWVDSELLILEPAAVTDRNPQPVITFAPASGTFTIPTPVAGIASGQDYLLLNLRGKGLTFGKLKRTIVAAWREVGPVQWVADEVNFLTDGTYRLAIPAQWRDIESIQYRTGTTAPWWDIAEFYRPFDPMLRRVNFTQNIASGTQLRVVGAIDCAEPDALTSVVQVDYGWLRDRVLGQLLAQSKNREDQQRAAVHLADAARMKPRG